MPKVKKKSRNSKQPLTHIKAAEELPDIQDINIETADLVEFFLFVRDNLLHLRGIIIRDHTEPELLKKPVKKIKNLLNNLSNNIKENKLFLPLDDVESLRIGAFQCFLIGYEIVLNLDIMSSVLGHYQDDIFDDFDQNKKYFYFMFQKSSERVLMLLCSDLSQEYKKMLEINYAKITKKKPNQTSNLSLLIVEYGKHAESLHQQSSIKLDGTNMIVDQIKFAQYYDMLCSAEEQDISAKKLTIPVECIINDNISYLLSNPFFEKYFVLKLYDSKGYNYLKKTIVSYFQSEPEHEVIFYRNFCFIVESIRIDDLKVLFLKDHTSKTLLEKIGCYAGIETYYGVLVKAVQYFQEISNQEPKNKQILFSSVQYLVDSLKDYAKRTKVKYVKELFDFFKRSNYKFFTNVNIELLVSLNIAALEQLTTNKELCDSYKLRYCEIILGLEEESELKDKVLSEIIKHLDFDSIDTKRIKSIADKFPEQKARFDAEVQKLVQKQKHIDKIVKDLSNEEEEKAKKREELAKQKKIEALENKKKQQEASEKQKKQKLANKRAEELANKKAEENAIQKKASLIKEQLRLQRISEQMRNDAALKIQASMKAYIDKKEKERSSKSATIIQRCAKNYLQGEALARKDFLSSFVSNTSNNIQLTAEISEQMYLFLHDILYKLNQLSINVSIKGSALIHPYTDLDLEVNFVLSEKEYSHILRMFSTCDGKVNKNLFSKIFRYYNKALYDLLNYAIECDAKIGKIQDDDSFFWLQFKVDNLDFSIYFLNKEISYDKAPSSGVIYKTPLVKKLLTKYSFNPVSDEINGLLDITKNSRNLFNNAINLDSRFIACYSQPEAIEQKKRQIIEIINAYNLFFIEVISSQASSNAAEEHSESINIGRELSNKKQPALQNRELNEMFLGINQELIQLKHKNFPFLDLAYIEFLSQLKSRMHNLEKLGRVLEDDLSLYTNRLHMNNGQLVLTTQKSSICAYQNVNNVIKSF